jgi:hypothetical protein
MLSQIEKKKLQNKSEIALGIMLEELASSGRKPEKMRHFLGETYSEGKKYVFKIVAEVMATEKFKLDDRVNHPKYGDGTVSKNWEGKHYSYDGNVSIVFDQDVPKIHKKMSVPQENVSLIE